jgi:hypothetical protein
MARKLISTMVMAIMLAPLSACQSAKPMKTTGDEQLITELQSSDGEKARAAASEVFTRGDSVIPALLALKGNKKPFAGASWLGRPTAAQLTFPTGKNEEPGTGVPIEVAALYLIDAIYQNKLQFAQSPYLTDLAAPPDKREAKNSEALIERAWQSTEGWGKLLKSEGIERLRREKRGPLDGSQVAFW